MGAFTYDHVSYDLVSCGDDWTMTRERQMTFYHEDYPSCGCEPGDCDGRLYGSDQQIWDNAQRQWDSGHGYCDHAAGIYECNDD